MKNTLFWLSAIIIFVFWPLSFVIANRDTWASFAVVIFILVTDRLLYLRGIKYHYFLYLLLPLIHPAYLAFPVLAIFFYTKESTRNLLLGYSAILLVVFMFSWKAFFAYSIFTPDPLANDTLVKKITLIPNRRFARIFENKTTIPVEKFKTNVFESLDLNNYFFGFHPQELGDGQNLTKFSFLVIIPFLVGLFFITESIHKKWLVATLFSAIFSLGLINNQDRFDVLLFVPISLLSFYGLKIIINQKNQYFFWIFLTIFIPVSLLEFVRILIQN